MTAAAGSAAERFFALPASERRARLDGWSPHDKAALAHNWRFWARAKQLPPSGAWQIWVIQAGRGFGKTRTGAEWVREQVESNRCRRLAIINDTAADVRDVNIEGPSGLLSVCPPWNRPVYEPSKRRVTWPNGAIAICYAAESPELLRGPEHDGAWCLVAGTQIRMADGSSTAIEDVRIGDMVATRSGARAVIDTMSRDAELYAVTTARGRLVGSGEHPVLTIYGWTPLRLLTEHDTIVAWADDGNAINKAILWPIASEVRRDTHQPTARSIGIEKSGKPPTVPFLRVPTSTTRTASKATTLFQTSALSPHTPIAPSIQRHAKSLPAETAALSMSAASTLGPELTCVDASRVNTGLLTPSETSECKCVVTAAVNSAVAVEAIAVNAVSTLGLVGRVYNLTIDDASEFFADGILTHNCDEPPKWKNLRKKDVEGGTAWDNLMMGLRIGEARCVVTGTPRAIPWMRELLAQSGVVVTRGTSYENRANLSAKWFERTITKYEGTRLGRQELNAELLGDVEGALWKRAWFDQTRVVVTPPLTKVVIGVDPAASDTQDSDETGIVAAGVGEDGEGYVLEDASDRYSPAGWARAAVGLYRKHRADAIVAEKNNGGDMVRHTLHTVDRDVPVRLVSASRGKRTRAEPVAAKYEQGHVHHVGSFPALEDQCATWEPLVSATSPDRLDALVWALTYSLLGLELIESPDDLFG